MRAPPRSFASTASRLLARLLAALALLVAAPALACTMPATAPATVGSFSPAAIKAGAVPYAQTASGFECSTLTVLTLLSTNFLSATIAPGATLKLTSTSNAADTLTYQLFANASSSYEIKPGATTFYMKSGAVTLLSVGSQGANVPLFVKLASGTAPAPGTYTGTVAIRWDWNFCNGVAVGSLCVLGGTDSGSQTVTLTVTLYVAPKPPTVALSLGAVTWDPVNGALRPKAIPGSKRRVVMTLTNPDLVATEIDATTLVVPTAPRLAIALDGDGTGSGAVVQVTEGSPPSGATIAYASPGSTTDQIDFSSDNGASWTYAPVPGDAASQAAVTSVRIKPKASMAAGSSISVSIPYSVR
ncbi:spore coat protein U domain-containing protein [Sphingomonas sp. BK235]|jgi:spore coat protein U-like protein|uniref:spore coat protein U domain-containing protein n=1 Tax=Sphingomonas sp. BK235 TaxID=2512131 RepID=UPI00104CDB6B|nr:spore coat protein U domain-containing protein [Sphingomonas sp. BK235]TCP32720.1 spore coat protein U-like protein [Sphingomonas sp. BK235]